MSTTVMYMNRSICPVSSENLASSSRSSPNAFCAALRIACSTVSTSTLRSMPFSFATASIIIDRESSPPAAAPCCVFIIVFTLALSPGFLSGRVVLFHVSRDLTVAGCPLVLLALLSLTELPWFPGLRSGPVLVDDEVRLGDARKRQRHVADVVLAERDLRARVARVRAAQREDLAAEDLPIRVRVDR